MPTRLVCTCNDATVRLLSPGSGECITTMLLPNMSIIADVAYAAAESKTRWNWLSFIIFQFLLDLHMSGRYIFQRCRADNWERSPPTGGPWVRIPDLKSCVGWLCSFLVFAPKIFPQVPLFSSFHKNRHSSPSKSYPLVQLFLLCTKF